MKCRPVAAQFVDDSVIAFFEIAVEYNSISVIQERQYRLIIANDSE